MDKFSRLPGPIADHYRVMEAESIEKCRQDPWFAENNYCPVCVVALPICLCADRCARCGRAFGQHACQCPGPWTSAFDKTTGERIHPPPALPSRDRKASIIVGARFDRAVLLLAVLCAIVLCLALAGCAGAWSRPGATQADLARDQAQCHYEAEVATAPVSNAVEAGVKEGLMEVACLKAKGWTR